MSDLDTGNDQLVGVNGNGNVVITLPKVVMTKAEAIRHAAWLVALADDDDEFAGVLDAVRRA